MSDLITRRATATAAYTPPSTPGDALADAIGCIITGRPLPESLRPQLPVPAGAATVQEGIARILAGPYS